MYKLIFGAKRRPGMSREEFGRYWLTVHAEKAKRVPGAWKGLVDIGPEFFEPMSDEDLALWEGRDNEF